MSLKTEVLVIYTLEKQSDIVTISPISRRNDVPTPASCHFFQDDPAFSLETTRQEYPVYGKGDFRDAAIELETSEGRMGNQFTYKDYEISQGKPKLEGLPATYADRDEATTLTIRLVDDTTDTELLLSYSIFHHFPAITRSVTVKNAGSNDVYLKKIMSSSIDFPDNDFSMVHLSGTWSRERHIKERKLVEGTTPFQVSAEQVRIITIRLSR